MFTKKEIELAKSVYKALLKLGWKGWKPEIGDFCLDKEKVGFIWSYSLLTKDKVVHCIEKSTLDGWVAPIKDCIPILHWEKIEKILKKRGYDLYVDLNETLELYLPPEGHYAKFSNYRDRSIWGEGVGKTRQAAVMWAVIALSERK